MIGVHAISSMVWPTSIPCNHSMQRMTDSPLTRAQAVVHANVWLIKSLDNPSDAMSNMDDKMNKNKGFAQNKNDDTRLLLLTGSVLHLEKIFFYTSLVFALQR